MELKEGMYVRFKDKKGATYIRKLTKLANEYPQKLYGMEIDIEANYSPYLSLKNILKASDEPIDLIKVGDYVNGSEVLKIGIDNYDDNATYKKYLRCVGNSYFNEQIKSIVTKEQFESMSYRVEN